MGVAGADYRFLGIDGAKHGFSNPTVDHHGHGTPEMDVGYNKAAAESSWADMQAFLKAVFQ